MIKNKRSGQILSQQEIYCTSFLSQARGLMFRWKCNLVMEFKEERDVSLHMFFVFFPIDVLILDKNKKIVEIKKDFTPFTFWSSSQKGKYVVEMGDGDRNLRHYEVGDVISFC